MAQNLRTVGSTSLSALVPKEDKTTDRGQSFFAKFFRMDNLILKVPNLDSSPSSSKLMPSHINKTAMPSVVVSATAGIGWALARITQCNRSPTP
jgi:hypothetical protein